MTEQVLGIGLVGAGNMGRLHLTNAAKIPRFRVEAIADVDQGRAEELAAEFGGPSCTSDYADIMSSDEIDVVFVCTPARFHPPICIAAAEAGKHVFCEKPLALDPEQGERMVAAAEKSGVVLAVNFQQRFRRLFRAFREKLDSGEIGRPVYLVQQGYCEVRPNTAMNDRNLNGGPLLDVLCHWVDLWRYLFRSEPLQVFARGAVFARGKPRVAAIRELAVDTAIVTVSFESGDVGCFQVSWGLPEGIAGGGRCSLVAPNTWCEFAPFDTEVSLRFGAGENRVISDLAGDPLAEQMRHFAAALRDGTPPSTDGRDGLIASRVSAAALESIETGQAVATPA